MTDREKLIELVEKAKEEYADDVTDRTEIDYIVECLLNNGAILPPCKVGDKIYIITNVSQEIVESIVIGIWLADGVFSLLSIHGTILTDNFGKTVFLTKEEAEAKAKEFSQK